MDTEVGEAPAVAPGPAEPERPASTTGLIGIGVSIVALAGVVWWGSKQDAPRLPDSVSEFVPLVVAIVLYGACTVLRAERWGWLLRRSGAHPSRADCFGLTAVGFMGNTVLPARGGDLMRVFLMAPRARTSKRVVIGTLVAERLLDVVVLLSIFVVMVYASGFGDRSAQADRAGLAVGIVLCLGAAGVLVWYRLRRGGRLQSLADYIRPMAATSKGLVSRAGLGLLVLTTALWITEAGVWCLAGQATDFAPTFTEALYVMALVSMFLVIPAGPGYVGTLDAAVVIGVKALGGSGSEALAYVLMLRFVLFVPITVAGLVTLFMRYGGWGSYARGRAAARA